MADQFSDTDTAELLKKIEVKLVAMAGGEEALRNKLENSKSPEDLLAQFWAKKAGEKAKAKPQRISDEKREKFKEGVRKVWKVLAPVGETAFEFAELAGVTGVSVGHAAFSCLVLAWDNYENAMESLSDMLQECVSFMSYCDQYKGAGRLFDRMVWRRLEFFVDVCDSALRMRSKSSKTRLFFKALLSGEAPTDDLRKTLDKMVREEIQLVGATGLRVGLQTNADVADLRRWKEVGSWRKSLAETLGFLDIGREPAPTWRATFARNKESLLPDMGDWLLERDEVQAWKTIDEGRGEGGNDPSPVLVLQGPSKSGRTMLMTYLLRNISETGRKTVGTTAGYRPAVAYFFADTNRAEDKGQTNGSDGTRDDKEVVASLAHAITRVLLWQAATEGNEALLSAMHRAMQTAQVKQPADFANAVDVWQKLFLDLDLGEHPTGAAATTRFFFFVDATDDHAAQALQPLLHAFSDLAQSSTRKAPRVRICLTATPEAVASWTAPGSVRHGHGHTAMPPRLQVVDIFEHNHADIDAFIQHGASRMDLVKRFPDKLSHFVTVLQPLSAKCRGDYLMLDDLLRKVQEAKMQKTVRDIVAHAEASRAKQLQQSIADLARTLTAEDRALLQEVVMWVDSAKQWLTVRNLEILLAMDVSDPMSAPDPLFIRSPAAAGPALRPEAASEMVYTPFLADLLRRTPSLFAVRPGDFVDWSSTDAIAQVPMMKPTTTAEKQADAVGSQPASLLDLALEILPQQIDIARRLLYGAFPSPEAPERHLLDSVFQNQQLALTAIKSNPNGMASATAGMSPLCRIPAAAHLIIALKCLIVLTEPTLHRSERALRRYAMRWHLYHLKQVPLETADRELKALVGRRLVRLLMTTTAFDALFSPVEVHLSRDIWEEGEGRQIAGALDAWVLKDTGVNETVRWMKDAVVEAAMREEEAKMREKDDGEKESLLDALQPEANRYKVLLTRAAEHMAGRLCYTITLTARENSPPVTFLHAFIHQTQPDLLPRRSKVSSDADRFDVTVLEAVEKWAEATLTHDRANPTKWVRWEANMMDAFHSLSTKKMKTAKTKRKIFERARDYVEQMNTAPESECPFALYIYAIQSETPIDKGIPALQRAKTLMEGDYPEKVAALHLPPTSTARFHANVIFVLGNSLWAEGKYARAAALHRESLAIGYTYFFSYASILDDYNDRCRWRYIVEFMEALNANYDMWKGLLEDLSASFLYHDDYNVPGFLVSAANAKYEEKEDIETKKEEDEEMLEVKVADEETKRRWGVIAAFFSLVSEAAAITTDAATASTTTAQKEFLDSPSTIALVVRFGLAKVEGEVLSNAAACPSIRAQALEAYRRAWHLTRTHNLVESHLNVERDLASIVRYLADNSLHEFLATTQETGLTADMIDSTAKELTEFIFDPDRAWASVAPACTLIRVEKWQTKLEGRSHDGSSHNVFPFSLSHIALSCIQSIVRDGVALLLDDKDSNDDTACRRLAYLFAALDDVVNLRVAWAMRSMVYFRGEKAMGTDAGSSDGPDGNNNGDWQTEDEEKRHATTEEESDEARTGGSDQTEVKKDVPGTSEEKVMKRIVEVVVKYDATEKNGRIKGGRRERSEVSKQKYLRLKSSIGEGYSFDEDDLDEVLEGTKDRVVLKKERYHSIYDRLPPFQAYMGDKNDTAQDESHKGEVKEQADKDEGMVVKEKNGTGDLENNQKMEGNEVEDGDEDENKDSDSDSDKDESESDDKDGNAEEDNTPIMFICHGQCDDECPCQWDTIYVCADCGGRRVLCADCYLLHEAGALVSTKPDFVCDVDKHNFHRVPAWDLDRLYALKLDLKASETLLPMLDESGGDSTEDGDGAGHENVEGSETWPDGKRESSITMETWAEALTRQYLTVEV